jgi:hypothetical protein
LFVLENFAVTERIIISFGRAALIAALLLFSSIGIASAETRYSLDLGFDFSSGDYGTGITSDSTLVSLVFGYYPTDRLDLKVSIPWQYESSGAITTSGGIRFGVRDRQDDTGESGPVFRPFASHSVSDVERSRSGLGDIFLSAGYILFPEIESTPLVRPNAFVKFPTAETGLGTDEYDFGAGLDLSKWINGWNLFGRGSAIFQGGKDDLGLKNFMTYEGGVSYLVGKRLLPSASLWGATRPAESSSQLLELRTNLSYWWSVDRGISLGALVGLSDSSPDYGFSAAVSFYF